MILKLKNMKFINIKALFLKKDSEKIRPLCIFCSQMIIYEINFDENKRIYFLIKKEKVFIKYMQILEKVRNVMKRKFDSELIYSKKYLKVEKK